ncbi:uncharacterized protein LOC135485494 isoform X2 [Lineus longissimus]
MNFTEALNACGSKDIKHPNLNHLAISLRNSQLEQKGPVEYLKRMIRNYITNYRGHPKSISGQFWIGLYKDPGSKDWLWADDRQAVPFIPPERPDARYAYINVSFQEDNANVTLGFDSGDKSYNYMCEQHISCPGIDDNNDDLFEQRSNQLITNDRVCPQVSQLEATCFDGLWRMSSCPKPTVMPDEEVEIIIPCHPIPSSESELALSNTTKVGAVVVVRCTEGYEFADRTTEREYACSTKGHWVPSITKCVKIHRCPALNVSGDMNCSRTGEVNPGVLSDCSCPSGYMFTDYTVEKRFFCQEDATWSDVLPECVESGKYCSYPLEIQNTDLLGNETTFYINSSVTYKCHEGHRFPDEYKSKEFTMKCSSDGRWDLHHDECHLVHCPHIPYVIMKKEKHAADMVNSSVPTFIPEMIDPIYGAEVNITCFEENQAFPDGTTTRIIRCNDEGEWQPAVPLCMPMETGPHQRMKRYVPPAMEAPGSEKIGTVAIVFIIIFFTGIVVLDLTTIGHSCALLYHNISSCHERTIDRTGEGDFDEEEKEKMNTTREDDVLDVIENGQTVTEKCFDDSSLCFVDEVSDKDSNSGGEDARSDLYEKTAMLELDRQSVCTQTDDSFTEENRVNHDTVV